MVYTDFQANHLLCDLQVVLMGLTLLICHMGTITPALRSLEN